MQVRKADYTSTWNYSRNLPRFRNLKCNLQSLGIRVVSERLWHWIKIIRNLWKYYVTLVQITGLLCYYFSLSMPQNSGKRLLLRKKKWDDWNFQWSDLHLNCIQLTERSRKYLQFQLRQKNKAEKPFSSSLGDAWDQAASNMHEELLVCSQKHFTGPPIVS